MSTIVGFDLLVGELRGDESVPDKSTGSLVDRMKNGVEEHEVAQTVGWMTPPGLRLGQVLLEFGHTVSHGAETSPPHRSKHTVTYGRLGSRSRNRQPLVRCPRRVVSETARVTSAVSWTGPGVRSARVADPG